MFDPSKMDLDLDNSPKKDNENDAKSETIENKVIPEEKVDILNDDNIQEDTKEINESKKEIEDKENLAEK
jgi:hypothetical protein